MAIKIDPQRPGPHYALAEVLNAAADTRAEAESEYKKAQALNPFDEASDAYMTPLRNSSRLGNLE